MRSNKSKQFREKHTGVNRESEKPKSMWTDNRASMGVVSLVIGVVMLLMINAYIPSMLAPVEQSSAAAVEAYGDDNWTRIQAAQSTQAQNTVSSIGIIPQILGIVAVLMVLTMLAV